MNNNYGMKLSSNGLAISGEQVVEVDISLPYHTDGWGSQLLILNNGELTSMQFNSLNDVGFVSSNLADMLTNEASAHIRDDDELVEIASNLGIVRMRYSSGLCVIAEMSSFHDSVIVTTKQNVSRVTSFNTYEQSNKYYKSGAGTSQLVPMLKYGGQDNIIAVYEKDSEDFIVSADDILSEQLVGFAGENKVYRGSGGGLSVQLGSGVVAITGFGNIKRQTASISTIRLTTTIPTGSNPKVDFTDRFSPSHYSYVESKREDWITHWTGVGQVGHVVDAGDTAIMQCSVDAITPTINNSIAFVMQGASMFKIDGDALVPMNIINLSGTALMQYICSHDMSNTIANMDGVEEVENFNVNGYSFGYGSGRWVDADLDAL